MGFMSVQRFRKYEKEAFLALRAGRPHADVYSIFRPDPESGERAQLSTAKSVYVDLLEWVHEVGGKAPDQGAWPTQATSANFIGISDRAYRKQLRWLEAHGLIYAWACPRFDGSSNCYWVVDLEAEHLALEAWTERRKRALAGDGASLAETVAAAAQVRAELASAEADFVAAEKRYATRGDILRVVAARADGAARMAEATGRPIAEMAADLARFTAAFVTNAAERGVALPPWRFSEAILEIADVRLTQMLEGESVTRVAPATVAMVAEVEPWADEDDDADHEGDEPTVEDPPSSWGSEADVPVQWASVVEDDPIAQAQAEIAAAFEEHRLARLA